MEFTTVRIDKSHSDILKKLANSSKTSKVNYLHSLLEFAYKTSLNIEGMKDDDPFSTMGKLEKRINQLFAFQKKHEKSVSIPTNANTIEVLEQNEKVLQGMKIMVGLLKDIAAK